MNDIDKLAWLYIREKRLLGARSRGQDTFYLPGGKREPGESDQEALLREIKEELSVDLTPGTIEFAGAFKAPAHGKSRGTMVNVTCYLADFTGEIRADAEIEEVTWLSYEDKVRCSAAAQLILDWLKSEKRIE